MQVTVPSFAKINLGLRVLNRRPDGFHEVRTVYQTISLHDRIRVSFEPNRRTRISLVDPLNIPDNLVLRAAEQVCERFRLRGNFTLELEKNIPMGAGLGGGSSNAASVLLTLPALAGRQLATSELAPVAAELGSDVPFFLYGGTALGLGRGTELFPLPEQRVQTIAVLSTGVHVSTHEAYQSLGRPLASTQTPDEGRVTDSLTSHNASPILGEFQTFVWALASRQACDSLLVNDFEKPVFRRYPPIAAVARGLRRLAANPVIMTGSGSAIVGFFPSLTEARKAVQAANGQGLGTGQGRVARFISRRRYRELWRDALGPAADYLPL